MNQIKIPEPVLLASLQSFAAYQCWVSAKLSVEYCDQHNIHALEGLVSFPIQEAVSRRKFWHMVNIIELFICSFTSGCGLSQVVLLVL